MLLLWLEFIFCSIVIIIYGTNLFRYGDVIAEKTVLGWDAIAIMLAYSINI